MEKAEFIERAKLRGCTDKVIQEAIELHEQTVKAGIEIDYELDFEALAGLMGSIRNIP